MGQRAEAHGSELLLIDDAVALLHVSDDGWLVCRQQRSASGDDQVVMADRCRTHTGCRHTQAGPRAIRNSGSPRRSGCWRRSLSARRGCAASSRCLRQSETSVMAITKHCSQARAGGAFTVRLAQAGDLHRLREPADIAQIQPSKLLPHTQPTQPLSSLRKRPGKRGG